MFPELSTSPEGLTAAFQERGGSGLQLEGFGLGSRQPGGGGCRVGQGQECRTRWGRGTGAHGQGGTDPVPWGRQQGGTVLGTRFGASLGFFPAAPQPTRAPGAAENLGAVSKPTPTPTPGAGVAKFFLLPGPGVTPWVRRCLLPPSLGVKPPSCPQGAPQGWGQGAAGGPLPTRVTARVGMGITVGAAMGGDMGWLPPEQISEPIRAATWISSSVHTFLSIFRLRTLVMPGPRPRCSPGGG